MNNRKDKISLSKELAALHNGGKIDVISEFKNIKKSLLGHNFFTIRHIFEDALPMLNASVPEIMGCVKHLTLEAGNDMAAGSTISSFILYCEAKDNRPAEVLTHALANVEESFDFITPAIIAGSTRQATLFVNKTIELTTHENIAIRERAVHAIGRINYLKNLELIYSVFKLECLKIKHALNHFALRTKLLIRANQMAFMELQRECSRFSYNTYVEKKRFMNGPTTEVEECVRSVYNMTFSIFY